MLHFSRLTPTLRAFACGVSLALLGSGIVAGTAAAAPATASPEVREIKIPSVAPSQQKLLKQEGLRTTGRIVAALPRRTTSKFSTIGVTWARGTLATPQVEGRVRTGGSWTSWQLLQDESNSGPDGAEALKARPGTAPLWVGDSDGVEIRLVSRSAALDASVPFDLSVSLVHPKSLPTDAAVAARTSSSSQDAVAPAMPKLSGQPAVVSRAGWGADERLRSYNGRDCARPRYTSTVKAAIVHHTAGANNYTAASSASQVRGIYAYHVKGQGWCDIGYNFLIDKFGTVFEGRFGGITNPVHGAHATSWNTDTVGVSLMGNFETATPTTAMLNSTAKLLAWKLEGNYRQGTGKVTLAGKRINIIAGHGDVMATACPGINMRSRMDTLRAAVTQKIGSFNTPIYRRWQSLGGEAGWAGSPVVGEHIVAAGRVTRFTSADIYSNPSTGTYWTKGRIRSMYRSLGETTHYLGWPTSDEVPGILGSRMSRFSSGAIYYSPATGAQDVYRAFYTHYAKLGSGDAVRLGLPTASQAPGAVAGSQVQKFANGGLYWTKQLGTREVNGEIYKKYQRLGAEKSRLGMPTRGDYAVSTGRATDFQGGKITWSSTSNKTTVTYK
ncbi:MAG: hypothetical protein QOF52_1296 [Propionibacteriaceae bacterium]|jgi:hypothetical protein|nr:repeat protein [Propionibacteriaceae bacterium]MDX6321438.1 hypothetical protein [Propionibacteriaceae bacterium]